MCVIAASAVMISSCKDNKESDKLTVTPTAISFSATNPSEQTVIIDTNVKGWNPVPSDNWIFISKGEGKFTVMVSEYSGTDDREGTIVVKARKAEETVRVTQTAKQSITLSLNPSSITFAENETGTKSVVVTPITASWEYSYSADWLIISKEGSTLNVTVNGLNLGNTARTATVSITATGSTTPVTLQVKQEVSQSNVIVFDTADGYYYGDYFGSGTANFILDFYNEESGGMVGMMIEGFSTLPSSFDKFKLDVGTYTIADNFAPKTFLKTDEDLNAFTMIYDFEAETIIMITGGTFNVALTGDIYTITTNFTGKDYETGVAVNNLIYKFTGQINWEDDSVVEEFPFGESAYSATTGTPGFWDPGPGAWNGEIFPQEWIFGRYYAITNFFDDDWEIFADLKNGEIILDDQEILYEGGLMNIPGIYQARLAFGIRYNNVNYLLSMNIPVEIYYDENSQTLDFSNRVNVTFGENSVDDLPLYFGILAKAVPGSGATSDGAWISDVWTDIKLDLKSASGASVRMISSKSVDKYKEMMHSKKLSSFSTLQNKTKNTITIDISQLKPVDSFKRIEGQTLKKSKRK